MLKPVTKHTRAPQSGRRILCPNCDRIGIVYHFAWCAVTCQHCKEIVEKEDWLAYPSNVEKRKVNMSKAKIAELMSYNLYDDVLPKDLKIEGRWLFHRSNYGHYENKYETVDCYAFDLDFSNPIECWDDIPFDKSAFHLGKTDPDTLEALNDEYCNYLEEIGQPLMADEFRHC